MLIWRYTEYDQVVKAKKADYTRWAGLLDISDFARQTTKAKRWKGKPNDRIHMADVKFGDGATAALWLASDKHNYHIEIELKLNDGTEYKQETEANYDLGEKIEIKYEPKMMLYIIEIVPGK